MRSLIQSHCHGRSDVVFGAMDVQAGAAARIYAAVCVFAWVIASRVVLLGLFVAVAAEAFDLREQVGIIALPGRVAAALGAVNRTGNVLMGIMETMAREEDEGGQERTKPGENVRARSREGMKTVGQEDSAAQASDWHHARSYSAVYAISAIAARRKRLNSVTTLGGTAAAKTAATAAAASAAGLGWVETVPFTSIRNVLRAALPQPVLPIMSKALNRSESFSADEGKISRSGRSVYSVSTGVALDEEGSSDDGFSAERTLFVFGPSNIIRLLCTKATKSWLLGSVVHLCVLLSSVLPVLIPAADDLPNQPPAAITVPTRQVIDLSTTCVFSLEFVLAVPAQVVKAHVSCCFLYRIRASKSGLCLTSMYSKICLLKESVSRDVLWTHVLFYLTLWTAL